MPFLYLVSESIHGSYLHILCPHIKSKSPLPMGNAGGGSNCENVWGVVFSARGSRFFMLRQQMGCGSCLCLCHYSQHTFTKNIQRPVIAKLCFDNKTYDHSQWSSFLKHFGIISHISCLRKCWMEVKILEILFNHVINMY